MSHDTPMLTFPALQTWLGKELEVRGIDAVIYTRYILSIMQQDHFEVDTEADRDLFAVPHRSNKEGVYHHHHQRQTKGGKRQHQKRRRSSWTAEDLKKNAVLECLHSVTGEECGIESLVEELCVKLKRVQEERERKHSGNTGGGGGNLSSGSQGNSPKEKHHSNTDSSETTPVSQAERYYEAFPALSDKTNLITTPGTNKPQGAWGLKGGKYRIRSPRDLDSNANKRHASSGVRFSKSASVSRSSTSPIQNLFKKHQRTNSLPDNVSEKCRSPVFLVPRYQAKKSNHGNGHPRHHHQDIKASARHILHNTEKTDGRKVKIVRKQKNHHNTAALKSAVNKPNKHQQLHLEDSSWYTQPLAVPSEHLEDTLHNSKLQKYLHKTEGGSPVVTSGDTSLEEAVSSLAESLCRDIMDDYNGDLEELPKDTITKAIKSVAIKCGQLMDENEGSPSKMLKLDELMESKPRRRSAEDLTQVRCPERGTAESILGTSLPIHYDYEFMLSEMHQNGGNRVWSIDSLGDPQMIGDDAEGQSSEDLLGSASFLAAIWQKDPENVTDPWPCNSASSRLKTSSPSSQMGDDNMEERLKGDDDPEKAVPLQVMVDEGSVMVLDGGSTTTHLPIGTGRSNDSLLRICSPTHTHHHSHDGTVSSDQDEHYRSFTSWSTGDGNVSDLQCGTPTGALTPADDTHEVVLPSESTKDSLSLGIKAAVFELTPRDGQTLDVNNALWATYNEGQPRCIQPPKIVRWDDGIGMGELRMHKKKGPFIEGGVYGSPYNSCNNSHYSSCSTSPIESSIRDLWDRSSASQEGASLLSSSLQKLLSPKLIRDRERLGSGGPLGVSTPQSLSPFECKSIDERSVIEDSLMDSPVFMGSRSSSRFDFARSMSDVGDEGSSSPSSGTETDEMISEAEFLEEVMKETVDIRELTENIDHKCNKREHVEWSTNTGSLPEADNTPQEWSTNTGSLPEADNTPQNLGFGLNQDFQIGSGLWGPLAENIADSGLFTSIMPAISKPEPVRSSGMDPDSPVGRPRDMFRGGGVEEIKATGMEEDLLISPKTHFRPIHEGVSPDSAGVESDTPRNVQLKDEESSFQMLPSIMGDSDWSVQMGDSTSLYKPAQTSRFGFKLEESKPTAKEKEWQQGGRWMEREVSTSLYTALTKGDDDDISKALDEGNKGGVDIGRDTKDSHMNYSSVRNLPRDRGPVEEPWDIGGGGLFGSGVDISSGLLMGKESKYGREFDSTVNTDFEQQIFPYDDEVFILEECLMEDKTLPGSTYYSSDLEQQWIQEDEKPASVKPIPAKKRKPRGLRYRPCSFFLEGNCRRAGCRFAHDLSGIPCRFWEEGQCLKEEDCPFLHGYPSGYSSQEDSRQASESEKLPRVEDDGDEQMVPEGLGSKPLSITKPKPAILTSSAVLHHNSPVSATSSSGDSTPSHRSSSSLLFGPALTQPVTIPPSHVGSHCIGDCSSGGSSGSKQPPRSLPIRIQAKNR